MRCCVQRKAARAHRPEPCRRGYDRARRARVRTHMQPPISRLRVCQSDMATSDGRRCFPHSIVSHATWYPTQHRIPRGMVSHTARYPHRIGCRIARLSTDPAGVRVALARPRGCTMRHVAHAMLSVACVAPVRVVTAWSPRCRRARRRSARGGSHGVCWWVGQAKRRAVSAASGLGGSRAGEHCGPLLVSTSSHPAPLPSASPLPSLKGYSQRCSLSDPDPPRA